MALMDADTKGNLVVFQNNQGVEVHGTVLRLTRFLAVFEIYHSNSVVRMSEALRDFRIHILDRVVYAGRAVVTNLIYTGTLVVTEVKLDEASFATTSYEPAQPSAPARHDFKGFLGGWQKLYKVNPEFKVVVADMQTFLTDLRLWLDQVELEIRSAPAGDRLAMERAAVEEIGQAMVPCFNAMHERLEELSEDIEEELRPVHQNFAKRQLHPLVLCSPFAYRTYHKPLGYAGDYEMVNMIARDPYEGGSLFAKVVNLWFLSQWPARAHRHRIQYLKGLLDSESRRCERAGRPLRVLNVGCGPACEVQQFLAETPLSNRAQFTLMDFNEETIQHASGTLEALKRNHHRRTSLHFQRQSVTQLLKEAAKSVSGPTERKFDLIYCAGLFDYLADRTCKQLTSVFYDWLPPGGLLAVTNVDACKPFRHMLEFVLDWHLIYRDGRGAAAFLPPQAPADALVLTRDPTQVNLFLELRKPDHG